MNTSALVQSQQSWVEQTGIDNNDLPIERFDEEEHQANDNYGLPQSAFRDMSRNDAGEYSWM